MKFIDGPTLEIPRATSSVMCRIRKTIETNDVVVGRRCASLAFSLLDQYARPLLASPYGFHGGVTAAQIS